MAKLVLMITFEKLQHQPFKFQKITSLVPRVCGIGRKGPWYLKNGKITLLVLGLFNNDKNSPYKYLGKLQNQPFYFCENYKFGPCLIPKPTGPLL